MEEEERILEKYINGTESGDDNKLRATIGSLNAKTAKNLQENLRQLGSGIKMSVQNLHTGMSFFSDKLIRGISDDVDKLNQGMQRQVEDLIYSNEKLSKSNESYIKWMKWLTLGLVITSIANVVVATIGLFK